MFKTNEIVSLSPVIVTWKNNIVVGDDLAEALMLGMKAIVWTRRTIFYGPGDNGYTVNWSNGEAFRRYKLSRAIQEQVTPPTIKVKDRESVKDKLETYENLATAKYMALAARISGGGNCEEHADCAFMWLQEGVKKLNNKRLYLARWKVMGGGHEITTIGTESTKSLLKNNPAPTGSFRKNTVIVDPWLTMPQAVLWTDSRYHKDGGYFLFQWSLNDTERPDIKFYKDGFEERMKKTMNAKIIENRNIPYPKTANDAKIWTGYNESLKRFMSEEWYYMLGSTLKITDDFSIEYVMPTDKTKTKGNNPWPKKGSLHGEKGPIRGIRYLHKGIINGEEFWESGLTLASTYGKEKEYCWLHQFSQNKNFRSYLNVL